MLPAIHLVLNMTAKHQAGFELLEYQLYLLDPAPSDYRLSPNLRENFGGKNFSSNDELM